MFEEFFNSLLNPLRVRVRPLLRAAHKVVYKFLIFLQTNQEKNRVEGNRLLCPITYGPIPASLLVKTISGYQFDLTALTLAIQMQLRQGRRWPLNPVTRVPFGRLELSLIEALAAERGLSFRPEVDNEVAIRRIRSEVDYERGHPRSPWPMWAQMAVLATKKSAGQLYFSVSSAQESTISSLRSCGLFPERRQERSRSLAYGQSADSDSPAAAVAEGDSDLRFRR